MKASNEYRKQYDKILTEEQKEKQKKLRELQGNRRGGGGTIRILPAPGGLRPGLPQIEPRRARPQQEQPHEPRTQN